MICSSARWLLETLNLRPCMHRMPCTDGNPSRERLKVARTLGDLPDDLLLPILGSLSLGELQKLGIASKDLHDKVVRLGYSQYLANHPVHYRTLYPAPDSALSGVPWDTRKLIKLNERINHNLQSHTFRASMIGPTWTKTAMPVMDLSESQLLVAVGPDLHVHDLKPPRSGRGGRLAREAKVVHCQPENMTDSSEDDDAREDGEPRPKGGRGDVTGLKTFKNGQLVMSFADGSIGRFDIDEAVTETATHGRLREGKLVSRFDHPASCIQSLAIDGRDRFVVTATNGQVSIYDGNASPQPLHSFSLPSSIGRAWSSLFATESIPGLDAFLALGVTSERPLQIHSLTSTGEPAETPTRSLQGPAFRSSPYSLVSPPSRSRHSASSLLSAWYDSHLRLFDLRSPSAHASIDMHDPWSDNALYSCAWLGENHVASGASRHGLVSVFDLRFPRLGWSAFAPGSSGSPVYGMIGEGGRLWGVSERQSWVMEFDDFRAVDEKARPATTDVDEEAQPGGRGDGRWVRGAPRRGGRSTPRVANVPRSWVVGYEHRDQTVRLFESIR